MVNVSAERFEEVNPELVSAFTHVCDLHFLVGLVVNVA